MKYIPNRFSLQARTRFPWDSYLNDSLLAGAGVALITSVIAGTHLYATLPAIAFLYLPLISILASTRGLYAALLASLLAVLCFDFFLFPPSYTFIILNATDAFTLGIFLTTAILTGQLPSILQRRVMQAKRRERELRQFYAQAQEIALLRERQHLARELHDSLAQTLYGIGLEVETAQKALAQDSRQVKGSLDFIRTLAEAGLAEIRALLSELRPEFLEREGLVATLMKHGAVLRTRHHLKVKLALGEEPELPLKSKHAFGVIFLWFEVGMHFPLRNLWPVRIIAIPGAGMRTRICARSSEECARFGHTCLRAGGMEKEPFGSKSKHLVQES